ARRSFARKLMSFVVVESVTRRYDRQVKALDKVSLEIHPGEWLAVMGPSGSGKTSLLNLLGGLDVPDEGRIVVHGVDLSALSRPALVLADEPTGSLDEANERTVLDLFRRIHERGQALVMVTHDPSVGRLADRQIQLQHGRVAGEFLPPRETEEDLDEVLEYLWMKLEGGEAAHEVCRRGYRMATPPLLERM